MYICIKVYLYNLYIIKSWSVAFNAAALILSHVSIHVIIFFISNFPIIVFNINFLNIYISLTFLLPLPFHLPTTSPTFLPPLPLHLSILLQPFCFPNLLISPLPSTLISFFIFLFIFFYFCLFLFTLSYYKFVTTSSILCIVFPHKKGSLSIFSWIFLFFLQLILGW